MNAHEISRHMQRAQGEIDVIRDEIKPTQEDWGDFANLFDFLDSIGTLLTFGFHYVGLDHPYRPDNTSCDDCMSLALAHGEA
jgi:hypothetical protein